MSVDLLQLVPQKFRGSTVLQDFFTVAGSDVDTWLELIDDLEVEIDKYNVSDTYMQKLADLVGYSMVGDTETLTTEEKRRQLVQVIDWYKMKGTYQAISYIGYLLDLNLNFWDLYTDDYVTFTRKDWFVGDVGENPTGLGSTYYKSPHMGIEVLLDTVYGTSGGYYLFRGTDFTELSEYIELVRPINTIPRYSVFLNPVGDDSGVATTVSGNITTVVTGTWDTTRKYFDQNIMASAGDDLNFDDGDNFDASDTAFLNAIDKYELGTGNKGVSPDTSGFTIATPVLSGDITSTTLYDDRTEYEFSITGSSQTGISELGLYLADGTTLKVAATFPDIDLITTLTLRIVVVVYK